MSEPVNSGGVLRHQVTPEQQTEDPKHVEEMVKLAEGDSPSEELLAGKYKTEEDLAKGFLELVKKQNEGKSLAEIYKEFESGLGKKETSDEQKEETPAPTSQEEAKEAVEKAGLDFDEFTQEFAEKGELSDDSYKKLADKGISKEVVDAYISGQQALAEKQAEELLNPVGGQEGYQKMIEWAAQNLSQDEIDAYNKVVESGSLAEAKLAIEGLHSRFTRASGSANEPSRLLNGDSASSSTNDVFESTQQVIEAMSDPRYQNDPAYRRQVEEKIRRSSNIL